MRGESGRLHLFGQHALVVVLYAQPPLGVHHSPFALDHLRREGKIGDPVGLKVEHEVEGIARKPVLVNGYVIACKRVVRAAARFHLAIELARLAARGAVEHHVLEKMRKSGDARRLIAAARAYPVVQSHAGYVLDGPDNDLHAIRKRRGADGLATGHCDHRQSSRSGFHGRGTGSGWVQRLKQTRNEPNHQHRDAGTHGETSLAAFPGGTRPPRNRILRRFQWVCGLLSSRDLGGYGKIT